jgi:hypothetical protein
VEVWKDSVESSSSTEVPYGVVSVSSSWNTRKISLVIENRKGCVGHCNGLGDTCLGYSYEARH